MTFAKKVLARIDALADRYLDILEAACNLESPTLDKSAVDAVGAYLSDFARAQGYLVECFPQKIAGDVVCITANAAAKSAPVSFSGHIDTVHPIGAFGSPAVRREGERMLGPGVLDCKGGVVAALLAIDALVSEGYSERPLRLLLQTDEEVGSSISEHKTIRKICELAQDSAAFLNMEGHKSGKAILRRKGILRYRFAVYGRACHSANCYDGASAIAEAASKLLRLERLKDGDGLTCNCGVIRGGTVANTVAEQCEFIADFRFATEAEEQQVRSLARLVAEETAVAGCSCELSEISYRPAMPHSEKNIALLKKMNEGYRALGLPVLQASQSKGGSDAAYTTLFGIPTVDCLGTEGGSLHSVNEFIYTASLAESAKRVAAAVLML